MKTTLSGLFSLTLMFGLTACQQVSKEDVDTPSATMEEQMSPKEQTVVNEMLWVKTADATTDAKQALESSKKDAHGKPELIAFSGRGLRYPGLSSSQYEEIKNKTTYRVPTGTGDVIYGNTHKALRKQVSDYASEYNSIIYAALTK